MPRHTRLFELIRQQNRAAGVAARLGNRLGAAQMDDAALLVIARRGAASWQKIR